MSIAPLPRFSNVNWFNSHNEHCHSMTIGNYSTLLIGDSIMAGLSRYSNIWNRYFKPLSAINCGIGGDRVMMMMMNCLCDMVDQRKALSLISSWDHCQRSSPLRISGMPRAGLEPAQNILWGCQNSTSSPHLQNAVIMFGTNNIQHNSVEDTVDGIVEIALSLRRKHHPIAIFLCDLLPRDNNWSISRICIDKINNYLYCKSKLNGINFINQIDWTLQDGSLKPNLFYAAKLHFIEKEMLN